jgi:hypothetical protein
MNKKDFLKAGVKKGITNIINILIPSLFGCKS